MAVAEKNAEKAGLSSRLLMENAGREIVAFLLAQFPKSLEQGVIVLCGKGNNGGDGFVVARILHSYGYPVQVIFSGESDQGKGDAQENARIFKQFGGEIIPLKNLDATNTFLHCFLRCGMIVDALYGTGFRGELRDIEESLVEFVNAFADKHHVPIVSVDIPSGVQGETGEVVGRCVFSDVTIALGSLKIGHILSPGARACGDVFVADIGIPQALLEGGKVSRTLITEEQVAALFQEKFPRSSYCHKGSRGKVLVVGGSPGYFGAGKLAAETALRSGAGLVSLLLPESVANTLSTELCEVIAHFYPDNNLESFVESRLETFLSGWDSIVLGPGLSQSENAKKLTVGVLRFSKKLEKPIVIDADALNILSGIDNYPALLGKHCVLTPHPGEMARLTKSDVEVIEGARFEVTTALSERCQSTVILKGGRSVISSAAGELSVSPVSTPVLATAGSGDVLSGVIGMLLSRGFSPFEASSAGVFIHGSAGELLQDDHPEGVGVVSGDISQAISQVIVKVIKEQTGEKQFLVKALSRVF